LPDHRAPEGAIVCLERGIELAGVRLRLRDWPGQDGPLVHVPDPLAPGNVVVDALAAQFAPPYRLLSVEPRAAHPYQTQAVDLRATLEQFGFAAPILIGERLGCIAALLVAAWYPDVIGRLVLVDPVYEASPLHELTIEARALRECPPDWPSLRSSVHCPVQVVRWTDRLGAEDLRGFLQIP
jgi:pimeloyl-ACP methyl ester carboxylesterase